MDRSDLKVFLSHARISEPGGIKVELPVIAVAFPVCRDKVVHFAAYAVNDGAIIITTSISVGYRTLESFYSPSRMSRLVTAPRYASGNSWLLHSSNNLGVKSHGNRCKKNVANKICKNSEDLAQYQNGGHIQQWLSFTSISRHLPVSYSYLHFLLLRLLTKKKTGDTRNETNLDLTLFLTLTSTLQSIYLLSKSVRYFITCLQGSLKHYVRPNYFVYQ